MRDLVVHAWTSLDGYSCDEGTEMFRVMGDIDDPVGDDLFVRRLAGAGTHIMGKFIESRDGEVVTGKRFPIVWRFAGLAFHAE